MRNCSWLIFSLLLALCFSSCKNDEVLSPSIQLEFINGTTNNDGLLQTITIDNGTVLKVNQDKTNSKFDPDITKRMIANIEQLPNHFSNIYALANVISGNPVSEKDFADGIKTDPVDLLSIWQGGNYVNMVLLVKVNNEKHNFHFIEQSKEEVAPGKVVVHVMLYHDANTTEPLFNVRRAYLSIPVNQYFDDNTSEVQLNFSYNSYTDGVVNCKPYLFKK